MKRITGITLFLTVLLAVSASSVWAAPAGYIDPNTGGMIAQVLLVILAGISGFFYVFKNRVVMMWNRMTNKTEETAVVDEMAEATPETPVQE